MVNAATQKKSRTRRAVIALRVVAWILASSMALTAPGYLFERPDVDILRLHPVDAEATVVTAYINGMGGDPMVDYRFRVHGTGTQAQGLAASSATATSCGYPPVPRFASNMPRLTHLCRALATPALLMTPGCQLDKTAASTPSEGS